jgi:hypothetical protein
LSSISFNRQTRGSGRARHSARSSSRRMKRWLAAIIVTLAVYAIMQWVLSGVGRSRFSRRVVALQGDVIHRRPPSGVKPTMLRVLKKLPSYSGDGSCISSPRDFSLDGSRVHVEHGNGYLTNQRCYVCRKPLPTIVRRSRLSDGARSASWASQLPPCASVALPNRICRP